MGVISLYVSGKYSLKTLDGGWSCIIDEGDNIREFCGGAGKTSHNRMTLLGMVHALHSISHHPHGTTIRVETDNKLLAEGLDGKAQRWKTRGWKDRGGSMVNHQDLWRRILKLISRFKAQTDYVPNPQEDSLLGRARYLCTARESEKPLSIFVDGSYFPERRVGGWGAVIDDQGAVYEASGAMAITDNNLMELIAVIRSLELIEDRPEAIIYTDSQYVQINAARLDEWRENNWKTPAGSRVKNHLWWQKLDTMLSKMNVRIEWVKGHSGIAHNVTADRLAGRAARSRLSGTMDEFGYSAGACNA